MRNRPGRSLTVIRPADGSAARELVTVRWGLNPAWAKDPAIGNKMINARAEDVAEKPAFHGAFKTRRCIVPASGFHEWKRQTDFTDAWASSSMRPTSIAFRSSLPQLGGRAYK